MSGDEGQQNMVSGGTSNLPPLRGMSFQGNLYENFKSYKQRLEIYLAATGLDEAKEKRKVSILLNYIGDQGIRIYNSFNCNGEESLQQIIDKFLLYFAPRRSLTIQRNEFFTVCQNDKSLEDYFQTVINLGNTCELGDLRESLTASKIIAGLNNNYNNLKTKLMAEEDSKLSLDYVMKYLLSAEASNKYVKEKVEAQNNMDQNEVLVINKRVSTKIIKNCRYCASTHNLNQCPAYGKNCHKCQKPNHFSKVCRSSRKQNIQKQVNIVEERNSADDSEESDFFVGYIGNEIIQEFTVNKTKIPIKMDTGAACNVIGTEVCRQLNLKNAEILPCAKKLFNLMVNVYQLEVLVG